MASNVLANAAAAVSAGFIKTNTDRGTGGIGAGGAPVYPASERFKTVFSFVTGGEPGVDGYNVELSGYGVDQNTAEINALANLNNWRINRYGADSTLPNATISQPGLSGATPTKDAASAANKHTKDKS